MNSTRRTKPDFGGVGNYFRHNIARILELVVIITAVFVTMQHNIETQGAILKTVVDHQAAQQIIISDLTVAVAELRVKVEQIQKDDDDLADELSAFKRLEERRHYGSTTK